MSSESSVKEGERLSCPCCRIFLDDANLFCGRIENGSSSPRTESAGGSGTNTPSSSIDASSPFRSNEYDDTTTNDHAPMVVLPPLEAWKRLQSHRCCFLVDTHCHAHLERESSTVYHHNPQQHDDNNNNTPNADAPTEPLANNSSISDTAAELKGMIVSLSCAVEQADWESCLDYAAQSPHRIAALGIHPWYLDGIVEQQQPHPPPPENHVASLWLQQLEQHLQQHAHIMVGEIGLCQQARFLRTYQHGKAAARDIQRHVFAEQLALAVQYQRPVSIHCVNQQGVLLQILQQTYENCGKRLPPAVALHSFTGTAHHVEQLLKWEASVREQSIVVGTSPEHAQASSSSSPLLYFGFSHTVNYVMCSSVKSRRQGVQAILAVPRHRILAESDVHCTSDVPAGTAGAIAYLAAALGESLERVADLTTRNGLAFLGSILQSETRGSSFRDVK